MTDQPPNPIIELMLEFRRALEKQDKRAMNRLVDAYERVYARLKDKIELLMAKIELEKPSKAQLERMPEYKSLIKQTEEELTKYQVILEDEVEGAAQEAINYAGRDTSRLVQAIGVALGIALAFRRLPTSEAKASADFLAQDSQLYQRMDMIAGFTSQRVADLILESLAMGRNPRETARLIRDELGMALTDALRTARTAQLWAYREASLANFRNNSDIIEGWYWFADLPGDPCMACIAEHGTFHGLDEILDDHYNGRCYPADTLVSGISIEAFIARDYDGDMLTFKTASGEFFTVTPNHPILTPNGWIEAQFIQSGDYMIHNTGLQRTTASINPNKNHGITRIQDIPRALKMDVLRGVPGTTKYFNRQSINSNINVINPNRLLRNNRPLVIPVFSEPITQHLFGSRLLALDFPGICSQNLLAFSNNAPTAGFLCGKHNFFALFGRILGSHKTIGIGRSANSNSALPESANNYRAGDPKTFGDFVLRFPGQISPDKVINVDVIKFHGEVYNLQTKDGWYNASNIITHNCAMMPAIRGLPSPIEQSGEDWFNSLSEADQQRLMGKEFYSAWKDGLFELKDMPHKVEDAVYGNMTTARPLWDLLGAEPPLRTE